MNLVKIFLFFLIYITAPLQAFGADFSVDISFAATQSHILGNINYTIPPGYHAYSNQPGKTGLPTALKFALAENSALNTLYPPGIEKPDIYDPKIMTSVYQGEVDLFVILPEDARGEKYSAQLDMLLCSNKHCIPVKKELTGFIPQEPMPLADAPWKNSQLLHDIEDFSAELLSETNQPVQATAAPDAGHNKAVKLELELDPQYASPELEIFSLGKALLLGLLAGLILNAMPCVLPILALKINGLLLAGNLSNRKKMRLFRLHNLFFAAGILTLFTLLALILGAADLMWGQLYQSQALLLIMLVIVFLMGLSMLGVFTLPTFNLRLGMNSKNPALQAYCSGLLCTFLATPCSGPLLGGVLAWAFTQPLPILLAVFWAVGLGMSLPYLAFCVWPKMARILPGPGNWMYIFEHILGFLLLGTSLYLLSILPESRRLHVLSALLGVSFCAWLWGKFCGLTAPVWRRRLGTVLGLLILAGSVFWLLQPPEQNLAWQKFNPETFMEEIGKRNMLVEFTADWCPNCKFLEATILTRKNLMPLQKHYKITLVTVDLTDANPYGEKLLAMLGGKSIPVTALFAKGAKSHAPLVLRDIYTFDKLETAIKTQFN